MHHRAKLDALGLQRAQETAQFHQGLLTNSAYLNSLRAIDTETLGLWRAQRPLLAYHRVGKLRLQAELQATQVFGFRRDHASQAGGYGIVQAASRGAARVGDENRVRYGRSGGTREHIEQSLS